MKSIYLDYAAATPIADEVIVAMAPYYQQSWHNPSALYLAGRKTKIALNQARADVAHWLGARPAEIIFTAGATEANQLALTGLMTSLADSKSEILVSATEHAAVLGAAEVSPRSSVIPVDQTGRIDLTALEQSIKSQTLIVSVHYANNETGVVQSLKSVSALILAERNRRLAAGEKRPIYLHTDASQAAQYLDLHVSRLGVDLMTLSAGKIYGPKQVAALYIRGGIQLTPLLVGGGQERGLRSGTENVAGAVGMARALSLVQADRQTETKRLAHLRDKFEKTLSSINGIEFNGHRRHRLPNFSHISVAGSDGERLVMELDEAGIQAATGAACSANSQEPSHVLLAMALDRRAIDGSIRFSLGRSTTAADMDKAAKALRSLLD